MRFLVSIARSPLSALFFLQQKAIAKAQHPVLKIP
jgi:hypothetical protein